MGNIIADLIVKVSGDITDFQNKMGQVDKQVSGLGSLGSKFTAVGAAMTAGVTVPLVALGVAAVKSSQTIDGALRTIQTTTGATGKAAEELKASFYQMFKEGDDSAQDIAKSLSLVYQRTGQTGEGARILATQFMDLAEITGSDLNEVMDASTQMFGDWGVSADEFGDALNKVLKASQASGVGFTDLASKAYQFGSPLRQLGFTMEDTIAMLAKFGKEGVRTELVLAGMRMALSRWAKDGKDAKVEWAKVVEGVKNGTFTLEDAMETFGARAGADMFAALKEGRFELTEFKNKINDTRDALGEATEVMEKKFTNKLQHLKNQLTLALAPLGVAIMDVIISIMPYVERIVGVITILTNAFSKLPGPVKAAIVVFAGFIAALGPIFIIIGQMLPVLGLLWAWFVKIGGFAGIYAAVMSKLSMIMFSIGTAFYAAGGAAGIFSMALAFLASPLGIILIVVLALIAAFIVLYKTSETFRRVVGEAVNVLKEFAGWVSKLASLLLQGKWGEAGEMIKKGFEDAWQRIKNINWSGVADTIKRIFSECSESIQKAFGDAWKNVKDAAGKAYDNLKAIKWGEIGNNIKEAFRNAYDTVKNTNWKQLGTDLYNGVADGWNNLKKIDWGLVPRDILTAFRTVGTDLKNVDWGGIWEGLKTAINNLSTKVKEADWGKLAQDMLKALVLAFALQAAIGKQMLDAIIKLIKDATASIDLKDLATKIIDALKTGLTNCADCGKKLLDAIIDRIKNAAGTIDLKDLATKIIDALKAGITACADCGTKLFNAILDKLKAATVPDADGQTLGNKIGTAIASGINNAVGIGNKILTALLQSLTGAEIDQAEADAAGQPTGEALGEGIGKAVGEYLRKNWLKIIIAGTTAGGSILSQAIAQMFSDVDWGQVGETLKQGMWTAFKGLFLGENPLQQLIQSLVQNLDWGSIGELMKQSLILIFVGLPAAIGGIFNQMIQQIFQLINWETIRQFLIQSFINLFTNFSGILGPIIQGIFSGLFSNMGTTAGGSIAQGFALAVPDVTTALQNIATTVQTWWNNMLTTVSTVGGQIWTTIQTHWNNAVTTVTTAGGQIWSAVQTAWTNMLTTVLTIGGQIWTSAQTTWTNILGTLGSIGGSILSTVQTHWSTMLSTVGSIGGQIMSSAQTTWSNILTTVSSMGGQILSSVQTGWNNMVTAVQGAGSRLIEAARSAWQTVLTTVQGFVQQLISAMNFTWRLPTPDISGVTGAVAAAIGLINSIPRFIPGPVVGPPQYTGASTLAGATAVATGAMAKGGLIDRPTVVLAGEREPELFIPMSAFKEGSGLSTTLPSLKNAGIGQGTGVNIYVSGNTILGDREASKLARKIGTAVRHSQGGVY